MTAPTMGNRNVAAILHAHPALPLPWATWACLLHMAKVAHDDTGLYWAGVEYLQIAMGYKSGPSARRAVMRHLELLETAGYISRSGKKRGSRWVYELHLPDQLGHVTTGQRPWS